MSERERDEVRDEQSGETKEEDMIGEGIGDLLMPRSKCSPTSLLAFTYVASRFLKYSLYNFYTLIGCCCRSPQIGYIHAGRFSTLSSSSKIRLMKAIVWHVAMYNGCESWTSGRIKKYVLTPLR